MYVLNLVVVEFWVDEDLIMTIGGHGTRVQARPLAKGPKVDLGNCTALD